MFKVISTILLLSAFTVALPAQAHDVKVGFKMVKCKLFNANRCARLTIRIDKTVYQALGSPIKASYQYYKRNTPTDAAYVDAGNFVYDSEKNQYYVVATGLKVPDAVGNGLYYTLNKVCLDNRCQQTSIRDGSSSGDYIYKTLTF